jgi:hypothetical protein
MVGGGGGMCANAWVDSTKLDSCRAAGVLSLNWCDSPVPTSAKVLSRPSQVRLGPARGFRARGIFLRKWVSKVADDFNPYPTNIPYIRSTCGTCTSSLW